MYTFQPHIALFPFGFGMSYTSFAYSGLSIQPSNVTSQSTVIQISIFLKNTGNLSGADVVQLYLVYTFLFRFLFSFLLLVITLNREIELLRLCDTSNS